MTADVSKEQIKNTLLVNPNTRQPSHTFVIWMDATWMMDEAARPVRGASHTDKLTRTHSHTFHALRAASSWIGLVSISLEVCMPPHLMTHLPSRQLRSPPRYLCLSDYVCMYYLFHLIKKKKVLLSDNTKFCHYE